MNGQSVIEWLHLLLQKLKAHTDRPIMVRFHPGDKKIAKHMIAVTSNRTQGKIFLPCVSAKGITRCPGCCNKPNSSPGVVSVIEGVSILFIRSKEAPQKM